MAESAKSERRGVGFTIAGCSVLAAGLALAGSHGVDVVERLMFVDEAVALEAPGKYRVQATRLSTWTLLQELDESGAVGTVHVEVRELPHGGLLDVRPSAQAYRYERRGAHGFSAFDFRVPAAGEVEVELSSEARVAMRLVDDIPGRLTGAREQLLRGASIAGGAVLCALLLFGAGAVAAKAKRRPRAVAPSPRVVERAAPLKATPPSRGRSGLKVLPSASTAEMAARFGPPSGSSARRRPGGGRKPDTRRVPSVA